MLAAKDVSKLLVGVPKGAWVALSENEDRLVAFAAELQDLLQKAREAGENNPIVTRVPETDGSALFL